MFFVAERESQNRKRQLPAEHRDHLRIDANSDIILGAPESSSLPRRKSLDKVYPEFTALTTTKIIQMADPDYVPEEEVVVKRSRPNPFPALSSIDESMDQRSQSPEPSPSVSRPTTFDNLADMIAQFPELESMIAAQARKLDERKIPMEFVQEYKRPMKETLPALEPPTFSAESKPESTLPVSTESKPSIFALPSPPPLSNPTSGLSSATESALPTPSGGSLLAGIDDLLSDRKPKLKSKRR